MTSPQDQVTNYYESYYKYLNPEFSLQWYTDLMWNDFGDILINKTSQSVLDLGCGTGQFLKVLEQKGFTKLTGVEIDKGQYDEAIRYVPSAKITHSDIFPYLERGSERYDIISLIDVIEHIPKEKVKSLLSLIKSHLNPGGICIIRTPNADSTLIAPRFRYIDFTHQFILNQESMSTLLRESGFTRFSFRQSIIPRNGVKGMFFTLYKNIFEFFLRLYLYTYIHEAAKRMIMSPNFITIVSNEI